jgi:hypothetical protein
VETRAWAFRRRDGAGPPEKEMARGRTGDLLFVPYSVTRGLFGRGERTRGLTKSDSTRKDTPLSDAGQSRKPDTDAMPCLAMRPVLATNCQRWLLNTNSNVPLRSLPRVHKQCRQLFCSLPSILPPPPPLSTSLPSYSPWTPVIAPTMTATIFTLPSTFPIPIPPLPPPIQIIPFPPPTIPQTFSTLSNQSISTHLMFRVQFLPSSPQNNTLRLNSHLNCPPLTLTPTSLITPYNWTRLQPPAISALRVHTSL